VRIDLHPRFRKRVAKLSQTEREQISEALRALASGFGNPHLHSGLGIRRLRKALFECRAGLQLRIIFFAEKGLLTAYEVMSHDELKAWLKSL
jgi:mRNA-degrading endonuclease RelE of RelBE toxin-antitoxin system